MLVQQSAGGNFLKSGRFLLQAFGDPPGGFRRPFGIRAQARLERLLVQTKRAVAVFANADRFERAISDRSFQALPNERIQVTSRFLQAG